MSEIWEANEEVKDLVVTYVKNYHPDLIGIVDQIAVIFRDKAAKSGGQAILGKSKKAPPILGVLANQDYKFILEIASDEWLTLTPKQREALVDHLLCACGYVIDVDTSKEKCFIRQPDFIGFREEIQRHGVWRPEPTDASTSIQDLLDGKHEG